MKTVFKTVSAIAITGFIISCGVKGDLKPPPTDEPAPVKDISVRQIGKFGLIVFEYPGIYKDGRKIQENFQFEIYKDNRPYEEDIKNEGTQYWFFDQLSDGENCYQIIVNTKKKRSKISDKVCILPVKIDNYNLPALKLTNTNEGVLIKHQNRDLINLYKVNSSQQFTVNIYKQIEGEYLDTEVENGKTYCYYYTVYISKNIETDFSKTVCIEYRDTFPPNPPKNIKVIENEDGSATLIWQESDSKDVVGYLIYKNGKPIIETPIKSYYFTDRDYKEGDTYTIYAVDKANNKSIPVEVK
ncbi:MAG: hypothetical protein ABWJ98_05895 [Hydrogenothermaceae bacterium]